MVRNRLLSSLLLEVIQRLLVCHAAVVEPCRFEAVPRKSPAHLLAVQPGELAVPR